jgi:O-antigen ligase
MPMPALTKKAKKAKITESVVPAVEPVSLREKVLLFALSLTILTPLWCVGGFRRWTQILFAIMSVMTFVLLFIPIRESHTHPVSNATPSENFRRLLKFPLFWCGLGLMGFIVIQWLNPTDAYRVVGRLIFYDALSYIKWLPTSVDVPLMEKARGPEQMLLFWGGTWLVICSLWLGLLRRQSYRILMTVLLVNFLVWTLVAFIQQAMGVTECLWLVPRNTYAKPLFIGSLINPNHASAYINLGLLCSAFYFWDGLKVSIRRQQKSGFYLFAAATGVFLLGLNILTLSRLGIVVGFVLMALILLFSLLPALWEKRSLIAYVLPVALILIGTVVTLKIVKAQDFEKEWISLKETLEDIQRDPRYYLFQANYEMFQDHWLYGVGAGCYGLYSPSYTDRYEMLRKEFYLAVYNPETKKYNKHEKQGHFFDHAHNDYMQVFLEVGVVGASFVLFGFCYVLWKIASCFKAMTREYFILFIGLLIWMVMPMVEYPLFNLGVLLPFLTLWISGYRLLERRYQSLYRD